jgi:hypothetical protein
VQFRGLTIQLLHLLSALRITAQDSLLVVVQTLPDGCGYLQGYNQLKFHGVKAKFTPKFIVKFYSYGAFTANTQPNNAFFYNVYP